MCQNSRIVSELWNLYIKSLHSKNHGTSLKTSQVSILTNVNNIIIFQRRQSAFYSAHCNVLFSLNIKISGDIIMFVMFYELQCDNKVLIEVFRSVSQFLVAFKLYRSDR